MSPVHVEGLSIYQPAVHEKWCPLHLVAQVCEALHYMLGMNAARWYLVVPSIDPQYTDPSPLSIPRSCPTRTHSLSAKPTLSSAFLLLVMVPLFPRWPHPGTPEFSTLFVFLMARSILSLPPSKWFSNLSSPLCSHCDHLHSGLQ